MYELIGKEAFLVSGKKILKGKFVFIETVQKRH